MQKISNFGGGVHPGGQGGICIKLAHIYWYVKLIKGGVGELSFRGVHFSSSKNAPETDTDLKWTV